MFPVGERGIGLAYRPGPETRARVRRLRRLMAAALRPKPFYRIKQAENNERLAHACGTCRMGTDPAVSVVDADCRAHGIDNLYLADGSVFPTSGAANPALTIAANALRVAEGIAAAHPPR